MFWGDRDAGQTFLRSLLAALPFAQDEVEQLVLTAPVACNVDKPGPHWITHILKSA